MASLTISFVDAGGINPLPAGLTIQVLAAGTVKPVIASGFTDQNGNCVLSLAYSTAYYAQFIGVQAPTTTQSFTTPGSGSSMTVTVAGYASASLTQIGYANAQSADWVRGAFGDASRTTGGVAYTLALTTGALLASLNTQTQEVMLAERLQTSSSTSIDSWAADFFGSTLPRNTGETDSAYIARIIANLSARKGTIAGLTTMGNFYGTTTVAEPWVIATTGACDEPTLACDSIEGCVGSQVPGPSVFIEVASSMLATVATQAALSIAGASPAGVPVTTFEVVGTTATQLST